MLECNTSDGVNPINSNPIWKSVLMRVSMKCPTPPSQDRVGLSASFAKFLCPLGVGAFGHIHMRRIVRYTSLQNDYVK